MQEELPGIEEVITRGSTAFILLVEVAETGSISRSGDVMSDLLFDVPLCAPLCLIVVDGGDMADYSPMARPESFLTEEHICTPVFP